MVGERIAWTNSFVNTFIKELQSIPEALGAVQFSIATFNRSLSTELEFKPISELFNLVSIEAQASTPPLFGSALESFAEWTNQRIQKPIANNEGDYRGEIVICWGGGLSDKATFLDAVKLFGKIPAKITVIPINAKPEDNLFPGDWTVLNSSQENEELVKTILSEIWWKAPGLAVQEPTPATSLAVLPSIIHLDL
jgi:uncharacterized protein YegL